MNQKTLRLILLGVLAPFFLFAQKTVITGTLIDGELAEPLMFATVQVERANADGTSELITGTDTDMDGKYQIEVEPGIYTIIASYVGYASQKVTGFEAKAGEVNYLNFTLSGDAEVLETVEITAEVIASGEAALMLLQKKSDKIQDGISSQEISRFAVGDAAGAMKKVTGATVSGGKYVYIRGLGDRYSLTQLNGLIMPSSDPYRNGAQLDLIPSNLIENIVTAKTFTPDQPGTFTGGNVNIVTKSFPEQFTLTISTTVGFNSQNNYVNDFLGYPGGEKDYFGYDDGSRALPSLLEQERYSNLLGFVAKNGTNRNLAQTTQASGTYSDDTYSSKLDLANAADDLTRAFNNNFETTPETSGLDQSLSLSFGNQFNVFKRPLGIILATSFSKDYNHRPAFSRARWLLENAEDGVLVTVGDYDVTTSEELSDLTGLAGLSYKIADAHTLKFQGLYSHNGTQTGRYIFGTRPENITGSDRFLGRALLFSERELTSFQVSGDHVFPGLHNAQIEWIYGDVTSNLVEPDLRYFDAKYEAPPVDQYFIAESEGIPRPFHFFRNLDDTQQDYKIDFTLPVGDATKIKFGSLISRKDRTFSERRFQYAENMFSRFDRNTGMFVFYGAEPFDGNPNVYLGDNNIGFTDTYSYAEDNQGYILANYIIDSSDPNNAYVGSENVDAFYGMLSFNVTEGLRFVGGARYEITDITVTGATSESKIEGQDLLPSVNLIYELTENANLRGTFSRTLARPNLREIAPFAAYDPQVPIIFKGNTDLTYTNINNYDLRYEVYMRRGEMFAVSGYYKTFKNPIVLYQVNETNNEFQYLNVGTAEVAGVELEFRKNLDFLSPKLEKFKLNTNVSYIYSRADAYVSERTVDNSDRPFEGQSPYIINASLIYENSDSGVDAVLSLNTIGDRLNSVGDENAFDIFDQGRSQLDFSVAKKFKNNINLRFVVRNILNNPYRNFALYADQEYTREDFKRGVDYRLSVSYTIK